MGMILPLAAFFSETIILAGCRKSLVSGTFADGFGNAKPVLYGHGVAMPLRCKPLQTFANPKQIYLLLYYSHGKYQSTLNKKNLICDLS